MVECVTLADDGMTKNHWSLVIVNAVTRYLVPAWAPNVHPMFVHFPIALLFTGVLIDVVAMPLPARARETLRHVATVLCCVGAIAALVTYFTGRAASQTVLVPGMAQALVKAHWDWALGTVWYFGGLTTVRLTLLLTSSPLGTRTMAALVVAGGLGLGLLYETAARGAELVYEQGVGVGVLPGVPQ